MAEAHDSGDVPVVSDGRARAWVEWVALALTLAPLVVSAIYILFGQGGDLRSFGDIAGIELRTRDVGQHMLYLGPYSRDGWYHPGPALFYVLAVPYRLLGSSGAALLVGTLLVNGASVVGMARLARRRGGTPLMLSTLVVCALVLRSLGPDQLRVPWNPYITVLPYGLLLFLAWAVACRDRWALPAAMFVASFLVQTHVGYLGLTVPLLATGAAWLLVVTVREKGRGAFGALVWPGLSAAAVGLVMWLPPLWQQLNDEPGNLGRIVTYLREGGDPHPFIRGWRVVARPYAWPPTWVSGHTPKNFVQEPDYAHFRVLPLLLLVVLAAAVVLWRERSERAARPMVVLWAVGSVFGAVATARTIGPLYAYRLDWSWVLGMAGGLLVLWAGWVLLQRLDRPRIAPVAATGAVVILLAVLAVVGGVASVQADSPDLTPSKRMAALFPEVRAALPPGDGDVVVSGTSFTALAYELSLVLELEHHGIPAKVRADALGEHRVRRVGDPLRADLHIVMGNAIPDMLERPDYELVAYSGDVPVEEIREWADMEQRVFDTDFAIEECFPDAAEIDVPDRTEDEKELLDLFCGRTRLPTASAVAVLSAPLPGSAKSAG